MHPVSTDEEGDMRSFQRTVAASLAILLTTTTAAWADPKTDDCEEGGAAPADTLLGECMDKIVLEQGVLLKEAAELVTMVEEVKSLYLGRARNETDDDLQTRIDSIAAEQKRAEKASKDTDDAAYDDMIEQADKEKDRQGKRCKGQWVESEEAMTSPEDFLPPGFSNPDDGLGDGQCKFFFADDQFGNTDVKVQERSIPHLCLRLCDDQVGEDVTLQGAPKKKKDNRKERVVGRMTDGLSTARKAIDRLRSENERMAALRLLATQPRSVLLEPGLASANGLGPCEAVFEFPTDLVIIASLTVAIGVTKTVTNVLDGVRDSTERACDQTAAGFNGSAACTVLEVVYHVSNGITDLLEVGRDGVEVGFDIVNSQQTDAVHACVESIKTDTEVLKKDTEFLKGKSGDVDTGIAELKDGMALLKILVEQNRDLLLSPQGRRDEFPLK
jgi:hypothetical protein